MAQLSNVSAKYGAPMGRRSSQGDPDAPYKVRLSRVYLDSGGYDSGGAYWGCGAPLYQALGEVPDDPEGFAQVEQYTRADNREHAKRIIRMLYPAARFYR
jgi:hypothetical protein